MLLCIASPFGCGVPPADAAGCLMASGSARRSESGPVGGIGAALLPGLVNKTPACPVHHDLDTASPTAPLKARNAHFPSTPSTAVRASSR